MTDSAEVIAAVVRALHSSLQPLQQRLDDAIRERDAAVEERDKLKLQRDALQQERDARVRECAALTRERESLLTARPTSACECDAAELGQQLEQAQRQLQELRHLQSDALLKHALSAAVDFDSFTLSRVLGVGGNGVVLLCNVHVPAWAVRGAGASRGDVAVEVAVKVLMGVENPRHTVVRHKFMSEYATLSTMPPHSNVMPLLAHFVKRLPDALHAALPEGFQIMLGHRTDPVLALVMPHHPSTLAQAARGATSEQVRQWMAELAAAVAHLWQHSWVHLDLKLDNVLVSPEGHVVLSDFGTAKQVRDGKLRVPLGMGLEGNQGHRAPEVLRFWAQQYHAHRDDLTCVVELDGGRQEVWALGVLVHELVAGKHPYGERYPLSGLDNEAEVDAGALLARGLSEREVEVLRRMVSRDASVRPADPVAAYAELCDVDVSTGAAEPVAPAAPAAPVVCLSDVARVWYEAYRLGKREASEQLEAWCEDGEEAVQHAAQMCLALLLWGGECGLTKRRSRARELVSDGLVWCQAAAERGEAVAQCLLGECFTSGVGVAEDEAQAVAWYRRAAEQGFAEAQCNLALCYYMGDGVAKDKVQAVVWLRRAAAQGHAEALFYLGKCFAGGKGVPKDTVQATSCFQRAAEQGHGDASLALKGYSEQ